MNSSIRRFLGGAVLATGGGELVIYDDKTLQEKKRIKADWLTTPTGKFNVNNSAKDIY